LQVSGKRLRSPILEDDGSDDENRDGEQVVVPAETSNEGKESQTRALERTEFRLERHSHHRIPVGESSDLNSLPHGEKVRSGGEAVLRNDEGGKEGELELKHARDISFEDGKSEERSKLTISIHR